MCKALSRSGHGSAGVPSQIDEGRHADTRLDGLTVVGIFKWPGPVHEGNGEALPIVDERADAAQREALLKIMSGQATDPFATMFAAFASTLSTLHQPVFAPIELQLAAARRRRRPSLPRYASV